MSSHETMIRNGATAGAVLGTTIVIVIWQALAQFVWTLYPYPCNDAADYSACKAGPGRQYNDFLGFFDEKLYTMIMHYLVAFVIAVMIAVVVIVALVSYQWSSDFLTSHRFRRQLTKNVQGDLGDSARLNA